MEGNFEFPCGCFVFLSSFFDNDITIFRFIHRTTGILQCLILKELDKAYADAKLRQDQRNIFLDFHNSDNVSSSTASLSVPSSTSTCSVSKQVPLFIKL